MYPSIRHLVHDCVAQFDQIPAERKVILQKIAQYIQGKYNALEPVQLVFICTHNSRRSHFGQIAAALAAQYYQIDQVYTFSGGTEATQFHPNAIAAIRALGFSVTTTESGAANPKWTVQFGHNDATTCFSKTFDAPENPQRAFAAIMTCSDAEQNCPFVPGTELRIGTTYNDPKASDGTPEQELTYQNRFKQITTEVLYAFSQVQ